MICPGPVNRVTIPRNPGDLQDGKRPSSAFSHASASPYVNLSLMVVLTKVFIVPKVLSETKWALLGAPSPASSHRAGNADRARVGGAITSPSRPRHRRSGLRLLKRLAPDWSDAYRPQKTAVTSRAESPRTDPER